MKKKLIFAVIILSVFGLFIYSYINIFSKSRLSNLDRFYLWTKEDPLFTGPDFDPDQFETVVGVLEKEQKAYQAFFKDSAAIFPINFLKDLGEVAGYHNKFMGNPSPGNARQLLNAYSKTQADYISDLDQLIKTIRLNPMTDSTHSVNFVLLDTTTTSKIILEDLLKLRSNAVSLNDEIQKRKLCLESGKGCKLAVNIFTKPKLLKKNYNISKADFLPLDLIFPDLKDKTKLRGPYIISTPCFGWDADLKPKAYPFYIMDQEDKSDFILTDKKLNIQISRLATTRYYRKVGETTQAGRLMRGRGLVWVPALETNIYLCPDSSFQNTLAALDLFYIKYKDDRLFKRLQSITGLPDEIASVIKDGLDLEDKFFNQDNQELPAEADAENLANYYGYAYAVIEKYKGTSWFKLLNFEQDNLLKRYLEYNRKLGNVHLILYRAAENFSSLRVNSTVDSLKNETYIYLNRNMYGLVYFPFSPSFYKLATPLSYLEKRLVDAVSPNGSFMTYQQALSLYTPAEIARWPDVIMEITNYLYQNNKEKFIGD